MHKYLMCEYLCIYFVYWKESMEDNHVYNYSLLNNILTVKRINVE